MTQSSSGKRIVIATFGSFGDIHPYIPITHELKARGHHPVIATLEGYREKIESLGVAFHPVRPDLPRPESPEGAEMMERGMDAKTGSEYIIKELIMPYLRASFEDIATAARGADVLITHPITLTAPLVAQKMRVRWMSSVLAPLSFFSVYDPVAPPIASGIVKLLRLSPVIARLFMSIVRRATRRWVEPVQELRAELGLSPDGHPIFEGQHSPTLVLALFSTVLGEPQRDWPPNTVVTGFPFYDRRDERQDGAGLAPELERFLDAGPPPVVFTLGSSAVWTAGDFYRESVAAAKALNCRAVLLTGDARNLPAGEPLPEGVAAFDYAPFGELLPRAAVVVHQGGIGTTAQALRAGKPMLVVPFSHDQPDNAARVTRLGIARTLPRQRYNARRAAAELKELMGNPKHARGAAEVGRIVRREDGAGAACDAIEKGMRAEG